MIQNILSTGDECERVLSVSVFTSTYNPFPLIPQLLIFDVCPHLYGR